MASLMKTLVTHEQEQDISSEYTPLLANETVAPAASPRTAAASVRDDASKDSDDDDKPLPKLQILLLCYARVVEPIAFFGIFPFVNQMVQTNGNLPEASVGFYSGLIESLFSLTQMLVMIFWGRASDRVGRKPVLVVSLIGITIMTAVFGLSKTIWQMILFRCVGGAFGGTIVTLRTMITELSTPKTQARAFSFFMFASNLGVFLGPIVGGALADPAGQYGGVFLKYDFFVEYPYALSTFATGFIGLTATVTTILFLKETLPQKEAGDHENGKKKEIPMSTWELIKQPGVGIVLYMYSHVMLLAYAYTAVVPVFWFTSVKLGGFGFTPVQISLFMALTGASQALWVLLLFPPLQHRFGTAWILRACSIAYGLFFLCNPMLNLLLRHANANNVQWEKTVFWTLGSILLCIGCGVSMSFTAIVLALNDVCPSPALLGTLNGVALSATSGVRAFSPALFTSIFAIGVKGQILGGHLIWAVFILLSFGFVVVARMIPSKAEEKSKKDTVRHEPENTGEN